MRGRNNVKLQLTKQLFAYFVVGAGATIVEWSIFYLCDNCFKIHYTLSTTIAFSVSTFSNWGLGRLLLFRTTNPRGLLFELLSIYVISIIGLAANLLIMLGCIEKMHFTDMAAKILATGIVFVGNFSVRKFWLYQI